MVEGVTLLLNPLLFNPFLSVSLWATVWEMGVDIMASWTCHELYGTIPAQSYL